MSPLRTMRLTGVSFVAAGGLLLLLGAVSLVMNFHDGVMAGGSAALVLLMTGVVAYGVHLLVKKPTSQELQRWARRSRPR